MRNQLSPISPTDAEIIAEHFDCTAKYVHYIARGKRKDNSRKARMIKQVIDKVVGARDDYNKRILTILDEVVEANPQQIEL